MLKIAPNNYLYHLSYDLLSSEGDESKRNNENLLLKRDIVWEIIVASGIGHYLSSPVASTIVFESPKDLKFWSEMISNFADRMYFVLSEVKEIKEGMAILISPNTTLDDRFQNDVVNFEGDSYNRIKRTRIPSSRF